jgi:small subunit ribosomal protein S14
MAKVSTIAKNERKKKIVAKQMKVRSALRAAVVDTTLSDEEREAAGIKLQKLPRDGSPIRVRNRCVITGRSRGYYRAFGLSRIKFRELASEGMIPGITKASW